MKLSVFVFVCLCFLSGCSGGTIGGLLPAPKITKGQLDGLRYTFPDKNISVLAPASKERGEWTYTEIREHNESHADQNSQFVGFKTPYDSHYYSLEVITFQGSLDKESFQLVSADNLKRIAQSTEDRWNIKTEVLSEKAVSCGERTYSYTVFHQNITSHEPSFHKYLLISQSYSNNSFIIVTSELNFENGVIDIPNEQIVTGNIQRHNNFVCSVELQRT